MAELSRPDVEPPTGPAPDDLVIEDITVGDGPEATSGSLVSAHYVGVTHDGGEQPVLAVPQGRQRPGQAGHGGPPG